MQPTHWERITEVKRYIWEHSDEPLNRATLAEFSGYSIVHLHRIFTAMVGESISDYIRRVRMEQAARKLRQSQSTITTIALDSGYETHAAFSKAFRQTFGVTPTAYKKMNPIAVGQFIGRRMMFNLEDKPMQPKEIVTMPDLKIFYTRAKETMTGPAFKTANVEASSRMKRYLEKHDLYPQLKTMVAIYPDPAEVGKEVRFDLGVIFEGSVEPVAEEGFGTQTMPAGKWAIFEHVGPYDTLWHTWMVIFRDWLPAADVELRDALPFEDYVDNPTVVPPEQLRTEIYIPIK